MTEPIWMSEAAVLAIHDRSLARHGGAPGVRDINLLLSALARPQQHFAYAGTVDVIELAAILTTGIVKNHPFVDGNKRTGFIAGVSFLKANGITFVASSAAVVQTVLDLAASVIDEAAYAAFLRASTSPLALSQTPPPGA
jgi:death-on-curing protein